VSYAAAARIAAPWWKWTLPVVAIVAAIVWLAVQMPWSVGRPDLRGFDEYKLPVGMAFPVTLAAAPDRSGVWFTLESSNRLGVLHSNGEFAFVRKEFESIEPLGLASTPPGTGSPAKQIVVCQPRRRDHIVVGHLSVAPGAPSWPEQHRFAKLRSMA
jgi:hypothetical protein